MKIKDKPFSVEKGNVYFNWFDFLSKESFTFNEVRMATMDAGSWPTCACGNQCSAIPRDPDMYFAPVDMPLRNLGHDFHNFLIMMENCFLDYHDEVVFDTIEMIKLFPANYRRFEKKS